MRGVAGPANGGWWLPLIVDLDSPPELVETQGASHLYVTVLADGDPVGQCVVASPIDPFPGRFLMEVITGRLGGEITRGRFDRDRPPKPRGGPLSATVVVCTKDRPGDLRRCLESLSRLNGPSHELLIVENRPATEIVQDLAREFGAQYVDEELPGLDRARNRGVARANTDLVLFTDDDVEVDSDWAVNLIRCFDDPLVVAATGLVLPACLDTVARRESELFSSHGRGAHRRMLDGTIVSPALAGSAGVGASMGFRRSFLVETGGFPEELDAGMPTGTGGDTYALHRALRAGYRLRYEPTAIAHHWHRAGDEELVRAFRSNGRGISASIAHLIWSDHDLSAVTQTLPVVARYLAHRALSSLLGRRKAPPLRLSMSELSGAVSGLGAYVRARSKVGAWGRVAISGAHPAAWMGEEPRGSAPSAGHLPTLSVVVPTRGRRDSVVSLVRCLEAQDYPSELLEVVVVVDGDLDGTRTALAELRPSARLRVVESDGTRSRGVGPARARNAGASQASGSIIVFLDDDVVPSHPDVLHAHATEHRRGHCAVAGPCLVDLHDTPDFFSQRVRNWWVDHTGRLEASKPPDFTDLCTGNFSIDRVTFEELGGFADLPRREDWEFSYRLTKVGVPIVAAPATAVVQTPELSVAESLRDRRGEGVGDVMFAQRHPEMLPWLPLGGWIGMRRRKRVVQALFDHPWLALTLAPTARLLSILETLGMRRAWSRLLDSLNFVAYWSGVTSCLGDQAAWTELQRRSSVSLPTEPATFALDSEKPDELVAGSVAALRVTYRGATLGVVSPLLGGLPWDAARFTRAASWRFRDEMAKASVEALRG